MVHPCGSGAFGYFETTKDVSKYTKVRIPGKRREQLLTTLGTLPQRGRLQDPNLHAILYRHAWQGVPRFCS